MKTTTLALGLFLLATSSLVAGPVVGTFSTSNCYPFSCFASDEGIIYQQVYSSTAFPGAISIETLSFFGDPDFIGELVDDAVYQVTLSTTSAAPGGLSSVFGDNLGPDAAAFGTFHIFGVMPTIMTLQGTPFAYNPANGNLLMQVEVVALSGDSDYSSFFQADEENTVISRVYANPSPNPDDTSALVTEFNAVETGTVFTSGSAVPEPGSVIQLGLGLAGLGAMIWRRRRR